MKYSFLAVAALTLASTAYSKTLVVNNNSANTSSQCKAAGFTTISAAVTAANSGDTILVCPGTYPEAVHISKSHITLTGIATNGSSLIQLKPTAPISTADVNPSAESPIENVILLVDSAKDVDINNISVNGSVALAANGCSPGNAGIYYRNASGSINNSAVAYVGLNPDGSLTGCQEGLAIYVDSGNGGLANLTVTNSSVHDYDKDGITASQPGTTLVAVANAVTGAGPTNVIAQNGVEVIDGAKGTVDNNVISANDYTPSSTAATSILFYSAADNGQANDNIISEGNNGIYFYLTDHGQARANNISKMFNYNALAVTGNYADFENNTLIRSGLETDNPAIYLCGSKNVVKGNLVNDAPIGVQDDRTTADGCNAAKSNIISDDRFYNVGADIQTITDGGTTVQTDASSIGSKRTEVRPSPVK